MEIFIYFSLSFFMLLHCQLVTIYIHSVYQADFYPVSHTFLTNGLGLILLYLIYNQMCVAWPSRDKSMAVLVKFYSCRFFLKSCLLEKLNILMSVDSSTNTKRDKKAYKGRENPKKKSRIRETKNLSTDADRRTNTILKRLHDLSEEK